MIYIATKGLFMLIAFVVSAVIAIPVVILWNIAANYLPVGQISLWNGIILVLILITVCNIEDICSKKG